MLLQFATRAILSYITSFQLSERAKPRAATASSFHPSKPPRGEIPSGVTRHPTCPQRGQSTGASLGRTLQQPPETVRRPSRSSNPRSAWFLGSYLLLLFFQHQAAFDPAAVRVLLCNVEDQFLTLCRQSP